MFELKDEASPFLIDLEQAADAAQVDALVQQAFGPGRYAKTAERLREGSTPIAGLSFVARQDGAVAGTVRLWPVEVAEVRLAFLGPIAVDLQRRSEGLGAALVEHAIAQARAQGLAGILLVGDPPYFGRFGFVRTKIGMPGPVNPARVLLLELVEGAVLPRLDAGDARATIARG